MKTLTRRDFLRLSAITAAGATAAACAQATPQIIEKEVIKEVEVEKPVVVEKEVVKEVEKVVKETVEVEKEVVKEVEVEKEVEKVVTAVPTISPHQAPMLQARVKAGELPPLEERLPAEPLVVQPVEEVGEYGGTWHRQSIGPGDVRIGDRLTYQTLVRWKGPTNVSEIVPNVAKSWEVSADGAAFTFHLRKGHKWSDGEPFTSDDWVFWYEDVLLNEDLNPVFPKDFRDPARDEAMVLEKIDDYTFKVTFASSYGLFIPKMAGPGGLWLAQAHPKHYMKQFHPNYVEKAELDKKVKDAGFDNWWELFGDRGGPWQKQNAELPVLFAWVPKQVPPAVPIIHERNPYYYKVDPEGNQLPYIDRIVHELVEDSEMLNMRAVAGKVDMQFRHIIWTNYPLFVDNAEKGNYRVMKWKLARGSGAVLPLNLNHSDPGKRELFQNQKFRAALSVAIDRDEINEFCYMGMGTPRQMAVIEECPYFKPEHATRYAEYDPDEANALLDEIGLTERDEEGFRKQLDGKKLTITIEYAPVFGPWKDLSAMVAEDWKEVGIRAMPKEEARPLFSERCEEGHEVDLGIWTADRCATPLVEPWYFMPIGGGTPCSNGRDWWDWYLTGGDSGEEPPEEVKHQYELWDKCKGATSKEERDKYAEEFFDNASGQLWYIGIVGGLPHVGIVKKNFRNVPEEAISDWLQLTPGNTATEQYFIRQG
jgi:peptide/nickel transport system substrate-binding protein